MCNEFRLKLPLDTLVDEFSQLGIPIHWAGGAPNLEPRDSIRPTDPAPILAELETMAAKHEIHYYVGQSSNSFGGGSGSSAAASWVAAHFTSETVGGVTQEKYDHSYRVARQVSL